MGSAETGGHEHLPGHRARARRVLEDAVQESVRYDFTHFPDADTLRWTASDKSTRIPISTFRKALDIHAIDVDSDEVECMVANMIYRVSPNLGAFPAGS